MQNQTLSKQLKVLVAPDSFKGSLSANAAADFISQGLIRSLPHANVSRRPIADGGEGTADVILASVGGVRRWTQVTNGNGTSVSMPYADCENQTFGRFAAFDVASVVGLAEAIVAPEMRTTVGVGQVLQALYKQGFRTIVVGLGGSSTNDAGAGMLAEVGFDLFSSEGQRLSPTFANFSKVHSMVRRKDSDWLSEIKLVALSDVTSPLCGMNGASHVFGPQKGFKDLVNADAVLANFGRLCERTLGVEVMERPGAGAAGGLGFGLMLLGAIVLPGATFILEACGLSESLSEYDWVITGEGKSDFQTLMGKGPFLLAELARDRGVPVTLLSGAIEDSAELEKVFDGCFSLMDKPASLDYAMKNAGPLLSAASANLARLYVASQKILSSEKSDRT